LRDAAGWRISTCLPGRDALSSDAQPSRTASGSFHPPRSRSRLRVAAYGVVFAALAWRLVASLAGVYSQFAGKDGLGRNAFERIAACDEPHELRRRHSLGFATPVCDAVAAHVPADGVIAVAGSASRRCALLVRAVAATNWPRRIVALDTVAAEEIARGEVAGAPLFLLAYRVEQAPDPQPWERLDGDADFSLWKARATPR
jgi:hypothetical protein